MIRELEGVQKIIDSLQCQVQDLTSKLDGADEEIARLNKELDLSGVKVTSDLSSNGYDNVFSARYGVFTSKASIDLHAYKSMCHHDIIGIITDYLSRGMAEAISGELKNLIYLGITAPRNH